MIKNFKKNILAFSAIILFAVSCSQSKEITPTIIEGETASNTAETTTQVPNSAITEMPNTSANPVTNTATPITVNPNSAATVQAKPQVAKGMNPAHGEPNHRCDIAVGAPLNSPKGNTATPVPQQSVTPVAAPVPQSGPVANPMNLAVNPAHGEPGHSCAIAVGAPFK